MKALLTKAQLIDIANTITRLHAKLAVKNVLTSGQALIKATIVVCKPEKRRMRSKKLALARQQAGNAFGVGVGQT